MMIDKNQVVQFHYNLKVEGDDNALESSRTGDPVAYLHGHGNIIKGLEKAMAGQSEGDVFSATISPEDGYGKRVEGNNQRVPVKHLMVKKNAKLKPGQVVSVQTDQGAKQATVIKAGKFNVDLDTNHPLAGRTLTFEIQIESVREATEEELAHGHAHGVGGHHH